MRLSQGPVIGTRVRPATFCLLLAVLLLPVPLRGQGVLIATKQITPLYDQPDSTSTVLARVRRGYRLEEDTLAAPGGWLAVNVRSRATYLRATHAIRLSGEDVSKSSTASGMVDGTRAADTASVKGASITGLVAGLTLGVLGTLMAYSAADSSAKALPIEALAGGTLGYADGFEQGFHQRLRERRRSTVLSSGLAGTMIAVAGWWFILTH